MDKQERNEKIELYGHGYDLLISALAEVPREAWEFKPSAKDWSVHEIIIHLADSEAMSAMRARKMIVEPGTMLMNYDESKWGDALKYSKQNIEDALQLLKYTRLTTYNILKTLPDEVFSHSVMRPDNPDPLTMERWLTIYANHIPNHINQIMDCYKAWKEKD